MPKVYIIYEWRYSIQCAKALVFQRKKTLKLKSCFKGMCHLVILDATSFGYKNTPAVQDNERIVSGFKPVCHLVILDAT